MGLGGRSETAMKQFVQISAVSVVAGFALFVASAKGNGLFERQATFAYSYCLYDTALRLSGKSSNSAEVIEHEALMRCQTDKQTFFDRYSCDNPFNVDIVSALENRFRRTFLEGILVIGL